MILENLPLYSFVPSLTWSYDGGALPYLQKKKA